VITLRVPLFGVPPVWFGGVYVGMTICCAAGGTPALMRGISVDVTRWRLEYERKLLARHGPFETAAR
jgi:hypothetical protein